MSRPSWTTLAPVVALLALVPAWFAHPEGPVVLGLLALLLVLELIVAGLA